MSVFGWCCIVVATHMLSLCTAGGDGDDVDVVVVVETITVIAC